MADKIEPDNQDLIADELTKKALEAGIAHEEADAAVREFHERLLKGGRND